MDAGRTAGSGSVVPDPVPSPDGGVQRFRGRDTAARSGGAVPVAVPCAGLPPTRIRVRAPAGVRWTLVVAAERRARR